MPNVVAIADGGPDWSTKGTINLLSYGIVWQELRLDYFLIQRFAQIAPGLTQLMRKLECCCP